MLSFSPAAPTRGARRRTRAGQLCGLLGLLLSPALASAQTRIMPLGDSNTHGTIHYNTYRRALWHKLQAGGYAVDFVGSEHENYGGPPPNPDFDPDHQGQAGWRAEQIRDYAQQWARDAQPDIVLLHVGTNDVLQRHSPESTRDELGEVIDELRAAQPTVKILLAQLIPLVTAPPTPNQDLNRLNALLPALVQAKSTALSPVVLVDQNTGFDAATDLYDYIHPGESGEEKMAVRWYAALQTVLGAPTAPMPPVAHAGPDQTLVLAGSTTTSAQLSGSGTDADGTVVSYAWTQVSGPAPVTFASQEVAVPTVSGLVGGTYEFALVVTDNTGLTSAPDRVLVTITSPPLAAATSGLSPAALQLWPNPTPDGRFRVLVAPAYAGEISYSLLAATGARVSAGKLLLPKATNSLAFDFSREVRQPGLYYLLLEGPGLRVQVKVQQQ